MLRKINKKKLAVEVVKIAAQRKRRKGENQIIVQRKRRVKSQIGVKMKIQ